MTKLLYISAYQYSGSTLTSFLLNTHAEITSLGHTAGWPFGEDEEFHCSCGQEIRQCQFYNHLAQQFSCHNLPFQFHDFGAAFKLSKNSRINRYLTGSLPMIENSTLENLRDTLLNFLPITSTKLKRQRLANQQLIQTAIEYHQSTIYLDNSLDPFRLRHLSRIKDLDIHNIHLLRNPRGVAASCLRHRGWPPELTIDLWLRHQRDIIRISAEMPHNITVHYDDICTKTDQELAKLHHYANLDAQAFAGDFKQATHHILGNQMRLGDGKIKLDTRWKSELSQEQLSAINQQLSNFLKANNSYQNLLSRYVD